MRQATWARGTVAILAALAMIILSVTAGCKRDGFEYKQSGREYTLDEVGDLMTLVPQPSFEGRDTGDAGDLRHDQLVSLRAKGGAAEGLADFLTGTFPDESRSVPYYAEEATVDGHDTWIVLEVWGSSGGKLEMTRLWVFDRESGDVLLATSSK